MKIIGTNVNGFSPLKHIGSLQLFVDKLFTTEIQTSFHMWIFFFETQWDQDILTHFWGLPGFKGNNSLETIAKAVHVGT